MSAATTANPTTRRTAYRICPFCEACCGLELTLNDNRIEAVRGHEADVFSKGYICPKGVAIKELHRDPDRLRAPLIKRNGRFETATWAEAYALIAARLPPILAQQGRDAVAVTLGNPVAHKLSLLVYGARLIRSLATKNIFSASTLDQMPKQLSSGLMYGGWFSVPVPDVERSDLLIVLGANPAASNGSLWTVPDFRGKAKALRARGGQLIVIDPRRSETADLADRHLFVRPGGDAFLLLGMLHSLFAAREQHPLRLGRLTEHTNGLDDVIDAILIPEFAPEAMAARCGIDATVIRQLTRQLADTPHAALYARIGTCTQEFGTLNSWLVDVINLVTGHLDEEGGAMFPKAAAFAANTQGKPGSGRGVPLGRHRSRVAQAPEVFGELPITCLAEEIETAGPGQVKALITLGSNPVLSAPNGARLGAALKSLDFMVSIDIYLNETTHHADVILPGRSPLEDGHYDVAFPQFSYRNHARYSPPILAAAADHPPEWETLLRLTAIVTGQPWDGDLHAMDDDFFNGEVRRQAGPYAEAIIAAMAQAPENPRGPERFIDFALRAGPYGDQFGMKPQGVSLAKLKAAPDGIDLGALTPRMPEILRTPSGKIELAPPVLLADLARVKADAARPAPPLVVIGRRQVRSNNSWMHNLPLLAKGPFRCTLLMHPHDAAARGLVAGDTVRIRSAANRAGIVAPLEMSDEVMRGVVSLPHGWGHDQPDTQLRVAAERPGANLNALLDENRRDPLSGNAVLSGVEVEIEKA